MSQIRTLFVRTTATVAVAVGSSVALLPGGVAAADPVMPALPLPAAQLPGLPGLPAIEQLSPMIQQAAADPAGASSLLMAAAAAFAGNAAAPAGSKQVADSVAQFVQSPPDAQLATAHVPAAGSAPGAVAHLPSGIDPANAVGPVSRVAPEAVPAAPEALTVAAPGSQPAQAAPPAGEPGSAPAATPGFGPDAPPAQDFMYPSIGSNCLPDGGNSIATALSVAGPATIPTPGPAAGQTAYVFTAVGTPGPAETQKLPLNVTWVNLTTGKSGSATLKPHPDINADGPTTLTVIADTGSGSIMSTIFGQISTKDHQCNFIPTIGSTVVP
ncbi:MAG: hypothetical protein ABI307_14270 [Mycobacterium sp.]